MSSDLVRAREILIEAWGQVAPDSEYNEALTWSEAGVDSLKSLQLLLRLEQGLKRSLSFDLFTPQMTVGELLGALAGGAKDPGAAAAAPRAVHLIPGIYGDEPRLAAFRRAHASALPFQTLRLPDLEAPAAVLGDLHRTAERLAAALPAAGDNAEDAHELMLVGYSFGAFAALATATVLAAAGRPVSSLCLIDPLPGSLTPRRDEMGVAIGSTQVSIWSGRGLFSRAQTSAVRRLLQAGAPDAARRLARVLASGGDYRGAYLARTLVLEAQRLRALRAWRPEVYTGPVLLFTSEDFARAGDPEPLLRQIPRARRVALPAGHFEVFEGPAGEILARELRRERAGAL